MAPGLPRGSAGVVAHGAMSVSEPRTPTLTTHGPRVRAIVPPEQSGFLLQAFRSAGFACHLNEAGSPGMDVIDLGNPPDEARERIRRVFEDWCDGRCRQSP